MPLRKIQSPTSPQALDEPYLVFYSSRDDKGQLWCPDCRDVEAFVTKTFGPDGPAAALIHVGQKPEWKTPENRFRSAPWNVTSIPTIIKRSNGVETGRLGEGEVEGHLAAFVSTQ